MAKTYTSSSQKNRDSYEALTEAGGQLPPQAVELEEAVLGALMLEKDAVIAVQEVLSDEAFYKEAHRTIYKAISELSIELKPIDLYTVTEKLKQKGQLTAVGGASFLAELTQRVGSAAHVEFHAKIIAQKYVQRELIRASTEIQKRSYDESIDVTDLIDSAESEIFKVAEGHIKRDVQKSKDILALFRTRGSNRVGSHKHSTKTETTKNEMFVPRHLCHRVVFHTDSIEYPSHKCTAHKYGNHCLPACNTCPQKDNSTYQNGNYACFADRTRDETSHHVPVECGHGACRSSFSQRSSNGQPVYVLSHTKNTVA